MPLYQYVYDPSQGYVVYRCGPKDYPAGRLVWARVHKTAVFVTEEDARGYCQYRNHLVDLYGSDKVPADLWVD